jgi:hypothetical protein
MHLKRYCDIKFSELHLAFESFELNRFALNCFACYKRLNS